MAETRIHSTTIVDPRAVIGAGCEVGPYCTIGPDVKLGEGCRLVSHVVLDGHTTIAGRCIFFPFACIGLESQDLKHQGGICRVDIGSDNVFREHVTVHAGTAEGAVTRIGSNCHFLTSAHVAHDCVIGNHVVMSGFSALAGHVWVEDRAVLSGFAAVHQFCRIGEMAMVGGCTKVVQDVAPYMIVDGAPAETRGVNKVGLERNGVSEEAQRGLREAYRIMFRLGLTADKALGNIRSELPQSRELEHFVDFCRKSERGITR